MISDFQSGARLEGLQGFEWPKKLRVELEPLTARELSNASLQILEETQQLFSAVTNAPVRVRLANSTNAKSEQFALGWRNGTQVVGETVKLTCLPARIALSISPGIPAEADSLVLSGDSVPFDNNAYFARRKVEPIAICYFGPDSAEDPNGMRYYLHRAFEQTNLSTRVLAFSNSVPTEAAQSGLLIIGATPSQGVIDLAETLLKAGRTVVIPLRDSAHANVISALAGGLLVAAPEAEVANYALLSRSLFTIRSSRPLPIRVSTILRKCTFGSIAR